MRTSLTDVASLSLIAVGAFPLFSPVFVSNYFYSCALCFHFSAKYSEDVFYANICTKNAQNPMLTVQVVRRCVFMARMVYVAVVASVINRNIHDATKNVVLNAFRSYTIIPNYMTYFAMK